MNKSVGILGCGWLGFPLAISLIDKGYQINGSTTSPDKIDKLKNAGINPFLISFFETKVEGDIHKLLSSIEILIINLPPKLRGENKESFVKKMRLLQDEIKFARVKKVIFVSSTSVYGDISGDVSESTTPQPCSESGKQLLAIENRFRGDHNLSTTIIRFGGLVGPERHPVNILSRRREIKDGNHSVNLIHLNDCIGIITAILENSWWNEILNGVFPNYPSKEEYYTNKAKKLGLRKSKFSIAISFLIHRKFRF